MFFQLIVFSVRYWLVCALPVTFIFFTETLKFGPVRLAFGPVFIHILCSVIKNKCTAFSLRTSWMRYSYSRILRVTSSSTSMCEADPKLMAWLEFDGL